MQTNAPQSDRETLTPAGRWGELAIIGAMLGLLGYLAVHQWARTGFFTAAFGPREMLALYGPILISFAAPIVRAVTGQRNPGRPFEALTNLCLALGSLWLLIVFPFDYSHLADPLPGALRFVLAWITNGVGRAFMILQVILCPISALAALWRYVSVRHRQSAGHTVQFS